MCRKAYECIGDLLLLGNMTASRKIIDLTTIVFLKSCLMFLSEKCLVVIRSLQVPSC